MIETGGVQGLGGGLEQGRHGRLVGRPVAGRPAVGHQRRVRRVGQDVAGQVVGSEGQGLCQVRLPGRDGLPGQAVDQVDPQVVESGPAGHRDRFAGLGGGVNPAQKPELAVVEGLHPQVDAIDARPAVSRQRRRVHRAGVGFQGHLDVVREGEGGVERLQQLRIKRRREQRGRAPAEGNAVHGKDGLAAAADLGEHTCLIGSEAPGGLDRVEIAVAALALAEGDVNVDAGGAHGRLSSAARRCGRPRGAA